MVHFWNFKIFQKESAFYDFFWTPWKKSEMTESFIVPYRSAKNMFFNLFHLFWWSKLAWKMVHFWNFQFFQKESAFYDFFWTPCVYFFKQSPLSDPRLDWEKRTRPNWILYGVRRVVRLQTFLGKTPGNFQWEVIPGGSSPYRHW